MAADFKLYRLPRRQSQRIELRNNEVDNTIDFDFTDRVMAFRVADEPAVPSTFNPASWPAVGPPERPAPS